MVVRSPISARALVTMKPQAMWYAKKNYRGLLHQDLLIELYVMEVLRRFGFVSGKILIKRSYDRLYCFVVVLRSTHRDFFKYDFEDGEKDEEGAVEESFGDFLVLQSRMSWEDTPLKPGEVDEDSEDSLDDCVSLRFSKDARLIQLGLLSHRLLKVRMQKVRKLNRRRVRKLVKIQRMLRLKKKLQAKKKALQRLAKLIAFNGMWLRLCLRAIKEGLSSLSGGVKVNLFCVNAMLLPDLLMGDKASLALWDDFSYWHRAEFLPQLFFSVQAACFGFSASMLVEALSRVFSMERRQSYIYSCAHSLVLYFWSHAKFVRGVKVVLTGTIDGQDRSSQRVIKYGKLPVNIFDVDVDYAAASFFNILGAYGLRVFVFHGTDPLLLEVGESFDNKVDEMCFVNSGEA